MASFVKGGFIDWLSDVVFKISVNLIGSKTGRSHEAGDVTKNGVPFSLGQKLEVLQM